MKNAFFPLALLAVLLLAQPALAANSADALSTDYVSGRLSAISGFLSPLTGLVGGTLLFEDEISFVLSPGVTDGDAFVDLSLQSKKPGSLASIPPIDRVEVELMAFKDKPEFPSGGYTTALQPEKRPSSLQGGGGEYMVSILMKDEDLGVYSLRKLGDKYRVMISRDELASAYSQIMAKNAKDLKRGSSVYGPPVDFSKHSHLGLALRVNGYADRAPKTPITYSDWYLDDYGIPSPTAEEIAAATGSPSSDKKDGKESNSEEKEK
ncbi:MAG: hypothetical protein Q8P02_01720, partial [Candidatus Micrarchaeota archaeon]|nr:hypothetical protein [Candidatus Micrarchaeota archaeon]